MSYYKIAKKLSSIPSELLRKIKNDSFVKELFDDFLVPFERFDSIEWKIDPEIKPNKYASHVRNGDKHTILLGEWVLEENGHEDIIHIAIHEIVHVLQKMMPYLMRFNELQSYSKAIQYEVKKGKKRKEIAEIYVSLFDSHLKNKEKSEEFFDKIYKDVLDKESGEK